MEPAFIATTQRAVLILLALLVEDVRFTMPPLPAWCSGITDVGWSFRERVFETPWLPHPTEVNGHLAFACHQGTPDGFILDPACHAPFDLPKAPPGGEDRAGR